MKKIIKLSVALCFVSIQAFANSSIQENCNNALVKTTDDKRSILQIIKDLMQQPDIVMNEKKSDNQVLPQYECATNNDKEEKQNE